MTVERSQARVRHRRMDGPPAGSFVVELPVRPRHCDAQGMLHAARYAEHFEEAFLRWLDAVGAGYGDLLRQGVDLVVVETGCTHHRPARLGDTLAVAVAPVDVGRTSLTVELAVTERETPVATATTTYVAVAAGAPTPLPAPLAALVPVRRSGPLTRRAAARLLARLHDAQRAFYAGGGSTGPLERVLDPDVIWRVPGDNAIAGTYVGVAEVVAYMDRRRTIAGNTFTMHPRELLVGVDHVASLTDGEVVRGGRSMTWSTVGLYRVHGGRVAECSLIPLDQASFDVIWRA